VATRQRRLARSPADQLSEVSLIVLGVACFVGVAAGAVSYSNRSHVRKIHATGTNAIPVQLSLALVVVGFVVAAQLHRPRSGMPSARSLWLTSLSKNALTRVGDTIRFARGLTLRNFVTILPAVFLLAVMVYCPFRMGQQVIGGLDPNSTVNAWGGPTYLGALLAHWLDSIVIFYGAALALDRLLVRKREPIGDRIP
jgi:hypothetical protein